MIQGEIFEYLTSVQKMYVDGESRETVFEHFLSKLLQITNSQIGFIAELLDDHDCGQQYFHALAETKFGNTSQQCIQATDFQKRLHAGQGSCFNILPGSIFEQLVKTTAPVLVTDSNQFARTKYPTGHPVIETFLGVPFFYEKTMVGAIILCNGPMYSVELIERMQPIQYICSVLLKGFNDRSLKEIYETFVDRIHLPVVMFQTRLPRLPQLPQLSPIPATPNQSKIPMQPLQLQQPLQTQTQTQALAQTQTQAQRVLPEPFDLSSFYCVSTNMAFRTLSKSHIPNVSNRGLLGKIFFDCFPNWVDALKVHGCIEQMFVTKRRLSIDVMNYYDNNIPEDIYTFKFIYIDEETFAVVIEPISEQLKAQKVVDELAKTNEEFFAKIVHEFRNPLNAIINIIALMNEHPLVVREKTDNVSDFRRKLQLLSSSCVTLATLSQDLTDYGQLKTKQLKLSYQPFDLAQCIDFSIGMMSFDAQKKNLLVKKKIANNVPLCIVSDPKRLRQVLVNLCSNAVKFTERGHIGIYCKLKKIQDDDIYELLFEIEDTGRGIDDREVSELFKPFHQVHPQGDQFFGTGLGLVICKYLVQLLGGELWVESEIGRGSKFFFTIKGKRCSMNIIEEKYLPIIKNKMCLLADPNKTSRLAMLKALLNWNVKVSTCDNVDEAEVHLRSNTFDIIIADIQWKHIFKKNGDNNTVFIVEADSGTDDLVDCLQRPVQANELLQHIIKYIEDNSYNGTNSGSKSLIKKEKPISILLAEDNYINRQVELDSLKSIGYQCVDVAEDGQETLNHIKEHQYDVLLLDLKMPILDGYQVFAYLNAKCPERKPFTIAMTGNALEKDKRRCLEMGMDAYLTKPIDMHLLKNLLDERQELKSKAIVPAKSVIISGIPL